MRVLMKTRSGCRVTISDSTDVPLASHAVTIKRQTHTQKKSPEEPGSSENPREPEPNGRGCESLTDDASGAKPPLSQMAPSTPVKGVFAVKFLDVLMKLLSR